MDLISSNVGEKEETMDPYMRFVSKIYDQFKAAFIKGDITNARGTMAELKGLLSTFPSPEETPISTSDLEEVEVCKMTLARDIYEHSVMMSAYSDHDPAAEFTMEFARLRPYYEEPWQSLLPSSHRKKAILGSYLASVQEKNKIVDFHVELKEISATDLGHPGIERAIGMEKLLSEDPSPKRLDLGN